MSASRAAFWSSLRMMDELVLHGRERVCVCCVLCCVLCYAGVLCYVCRMVLARSAVHV